jgi:hypothetical protein
VLRVSGGQNLLELPVPLTVARVLFTSFFPLSCSPLLFKGEFLFRKRRKQP